MSNIDDLRRQFYEDDDNDPFSFPTSSGSGTAAASDARTHGASSSARVQPYPPRNGRLSSEGTTGLSSLNSRKRPSASTKGKAVETPFMARLRSAVDDDDGLGQLPNSEATAVDVMDVDSNHAPRINRDLLDMFSNKKDDIQHLTRVWQNERHAPDILPVAAELLSRILDLIRRQMTAVNTLRSADVTMSEEDHYRTTLVQTEAERVKFVVRSYVRTRLFKIEQYSAYITLHKEVHPRLTESELRHAQRYGELVVSQFNTTVLGHLPEPQRYLDDDTTGAVPSMIPEPDKSKPVFFHAFDAIEGIQLDDGTTVAIPKDTIMLVLYRVIEQNLLRDEGELV